jgi:hypothetical protein
VVPSTPYLVRTTATKGIPDSSVLEMHRRCGTVNCSDYSDRPEFSERTCREISRRFAAIEEYNSLVADYYQTLAKKYERAAARPWRSIPPDPALPACFETLDAWLKKSLYAHYGWHFPPPMPPDSRPWWAVPPGPIPPEARQCGNLELSE